MKLWHGGSRRRLLVGLLVLVAVLTAGLAAAWRMSGSLGAPARRQIGAPPEDLRAATVEFPGVSGIRLRGWFLKGRSGGGGVVLLHGVRGDRADMLERSRFLNRAGYSVLLFDSRAHGESEGEAITFGHLEAGDARAAVAFLRHLLPGEPVAAIGVSLGGAACLLGPEPLPVDALVLESVYPTVEEAVANRLRIYYGPPGAWLTPLLTAQLEPRLGIDPRELRPIDAIARARAPVFIVTGTDDRRTTLAESQQLFDAAPGPKELWAVSGAAHVDLHRHAGREYEKRVLGFLQKYLRSE